MQSDYDPNNILEGKVSGFKFKTHKRFKKYYFNKKIGFENQSIHHLRTLLKEGDTFIDVGAHHGYYSLIAASELNEKGKIFAFEPVPENKSLLDSNIRQITKTYCETYNYAVSDKKGQAEFNIPWASDSAGLHKHPLAETINTIKVQLYSLDELFGGQKIDFVKIDTEGNELAVIRGMKRIIKENSQIKLLVEFNPECLRSAGTKPEELLNELEAQGFDIFIVDEENSTTVKLREIQKWEKHLKSVNYRNLLCLQKGSYKNILLFSHTNQISGAEKTLIDIAKFLQDKNFFVNVVKPMAGPLSVSLNKTGISFIDIPSTTWLYNAIDTKGNPLSAQDTLETGSETLLHCIDAINKMDPDLVITNSIVNPWPAVAAKILSKQNVWFIHEFPETLTAPFKQESILKLIDESSVKVIAASHALKRSLSRYIDPSKIEVIYPPLKKSNPNVKAIHHYKSKNTLRLLVIGSIEKNKRQLDVIKVVNELRSDKVNCELLLAGRTTDREYAKEIRSYILRHKLSNQISLIDYVDINSIINQADILIVSSQKEGFGRTIVEGMLASKVVIATKSGGPEELITDGKDGFLYAPGDIKNLAEIIKEISSNASNRSKIAKLAKHDIEKLLGRNSVSQLSSFINKNSNETEQDSLLRNIEKTQLLYGVELSEELTEARGTIYSQGTQINTKTQELESLKDELANIKNSKGWKVARSLQKASSLAKKTAKPRKPKD